MNPWQSLRRSGAPVYLAVIGAVVARAIFAWSDKAASPDEAAYLLTGENLWSGRGLTYEGAPQVHFPPFLPVVLGGLAKITPTPHDATVLFTFVSSVALVLILGAIAYRMGGRRAGVAALCLGALAPALVILGSRDGTGSEVPYTALLFGAVLVAIGWRDDMRPTPWRAFAVGGLVGAAYLVRPEGLPALLGFAVLFLIAVNSTGRWQKLVSAETVRRFLPIGAALGVGAALFVAPYVTYLHNTTGSWQLTGKTTDVNIASWRALADGDRLARDREIWTLDEKAESVEKPTYSLLAIARANPGEYRQIVAINVKEVAKRFLRLQFSQPPGWRLIPPLVLPFALLGIWRCRRDARAIPILAIALLNFATLATFFVSDRYLLSSVASIAVLAGIGLAALADRWRSAASIVVVGATALSLGAAIVGPSGLRLEEPSDNHIPQAAAWLEQTGRDANHVMTRKTNLPYYLPAGHLVIPPYGTVAEIWHYARFHKVSYLIVDPSTARLRPLLAKLVDGDDHSDVGFRLVHSLRIGDEKTAIFEVIGKSPGASTDSASAG